MPTKDTYAITPFYPLEDNNLTNLAVQLRGDTGKLSAAVHPLTAEALADVVVMMNSYYSNLIEGHFTHPLDIERAVKADYAADEKKRLLQLESLAHMQVNRTMRKLLQEEKPDVCSSNFLCWLHREFYNHLPDPMRMVKTGQGDTWKVEPGQLRKRDVEVGRHIAPSHDALENFMELFQANYSPLKVNNSLQRILAIAASHHRLAWIHPFLDGNGRVMRLFAEAYLIWEDLDASGLWSISRGLSYYKSEYYERLSNADNPRLNDYDGNGNLSARFLKEFCEFFLNTAIDQVKFMSELYELDSMLSRIDKFVDLMAHRGELRTESRFVIKEVYLRGRIAKGEVMRLTDRSDNVARALMNELLALELLKTEGPDFKAGLRINFPLKYAPYFFPKLFPPDIEAGIV